MPSFDLNLLVVNVIVINVDVNPIKLKKIEKIIYQIKNIII